MKEVIEFHHTVTEEPFIINPDQTLMVSKFGDNSIILMDWKDTSDKVNLEVNESYDEVIQILTTYYSNHKNMNNIYQDEKIMKLKSIISDLRFELECVYQGN